MKIYVNYVTFYQSYVISLRLVFYNFIVHLLNLRLSQKIFFHSLLYKLKPLKKIVCSTKP